MSAVPITIHVPAALSRALQALAPREGDPNTVIHRAVEEYVTAAAQKQSCRAGKYHDRVQALSTPVADRHLSARPASAFRVMNIRYV